jgi:tetratricopeptide (TPR) repeat protein
MSRNALLALGATLLAGAVAWLVFGPTRADRLTTLLAEKRWEEAEALARDAVQGAAPGEQADFYRGLGIAHGRQQEHEEAIAAYRAAYALRPEDDDLRHRVGIEIVGIGRLHEERGELEEAVTRYREAVETAPEIPHGHRALIQALRTQQRRDDTIAALRAALAAGSPDLYQRLELAWLLASHPNPAKRDAQTALELSQEALIHDRTPETLDTYAVALAALGKFAEAVRFEVDAIQLAGGLEGLGFEERKRRLGSFLAGKPYIESPPEHSEAAAAE